MTVSINEYRVKQGDTLHSIAQKIYGDASKAFEIALVNDLDYPYIVKLHETLDYPANVVRQGDAIKLPREINTLQYKDMQKMDDLEAEIFGTDFLMEREIPHIDLGAYAGGTFTSNDYEDITTSKGTAILAQDLVHRLVTDIGSLPYHPDFGSKFLRIIGQKGTYGWRQKAGVELARCFKMDLRVVDVIGVEIENFSDGVHIKSTIVTPSMHFEIKFDVMN